MHLSGVGGKLIGKYAFTSISDVVGIVGVCMIIYAVADGEVLGDSATYSAGYHYVYFLCLCVPVPNMIRHFEGGQARGKRPGKWKCGKLLSEFNKFQVDNLQRGNTRGE